MTGIATGGFSVYAESIGHYDSPLIEYATVPVMVQAERERADRRGA
jgi:trk system potassium uptake protein TrkH